MALTKQERKEYKEMLKSLKPKYSVNIYQRTTKEGRKELFILVYSKGQRFTFYNGWVLKNSESQEAKTFNAVIRNQAEQIKEKFIAMLSKDYEKGLELIKEFK